MRVSEGRQAGFRCVGMAYPCVIANAVILGFLVGVVPEDSFAFQASFNRMAILAKGLEYIVEKRFFPYQLPGEQVIHFTCLGDLARTSAGFTQWIH